LLGVKVCFRPGTTAAQELVKVVVDVLCEPDEVFRVRLHQPTNATIADGEATGTILDDDCQS
jgi:hypothetical protein